jgi:dinuclear metal center YbgI/SA1388 family protein
LIVPHSVRDVVDVLNEWFPPGLAESWDNVGLLIGDPRSPVRRVMTCLTVTPDTAAEAVRDEADLVVSHHPVFFRKIQRLLADGPDRAPYALIRSGTAVYSPHTAHDGARGGVNEQIAKRIGLVDVRPLRPAAAERRCKLAVFLPESDLQRVQAAVFEAGAGLIGEYRECSFRSPGTGTFFGSEQTSPTIGERGRREEVQEFRLEVVVPATRLSAVVSAMKEAHSYEEPAYDVYPLESGADVVGAGRMGRLAAPATLANLAQFVKRALGARHVEFVGPPERECRTAAIGCGAAAEMASDAAAAGCDVFLTGEARFHDCLTAERDGVGLILAGHYATERFAVEALSERMAIHWPDLTVWPSRSERDPATTVA